MSSFETNRRNIKTNTKTNNDIIFLSKKQKLFLIDGYSKKLKYNKQYIPIELCNIIIEYFYNIKHFDFISVFEIRNNNHVNQSFSYDIKSKTTVIKKNKLWEYNDGASYCINETQNII